MLTREALVHSEKTFAIEKVPTPAWAALVGCNPNECYLHARTLGADRWDDVQRLADSQHKAKPDESKAKAFAEWTVLGACNENGEPFFTEADIPALLLRPLMPLVDCATAVMKLNGVTVETSEKEENASDGAPKAN